MWLLTLFAGVGAGFLLWCNATLPDIEALREYAPFEASRLYSQDNVLLTEFYVERRTYVTAAHISEHVKEAFIAVEDKRFFEHCGIDWYRVAGAFARNLFAWDLAEGASTITQQLAKMVFLTPEKTVTRKVKEIILALQLERQYGKAAILELYLNHAYLGSGAYGIEAAAQTYFGKSSADVTIAEAALLATLPRAPSRRSSFRDGGQARERRNGVLGKMLERGYINQQQYAQALSETLPDKLRGRRYRAPYFVDYLRGILEQRYGDRLYTAGLSVYTTLDYALQQKAEAAVRAGAERLAGRGIVGVQIALVAAERESGRIRAMVGGTDYRQSQFNCAVQAKRQPGSAFKPVVYLAALRRGYRPEDIIDDAKLIQLQDEGIWVPQNYDGAYQGKVTLQYALSRSLNAATVQLAKQIGLNAVITAARDLGIASPVRPYLSSALGASELTLIELVGAYATLSHGYKTDTSVISRVIDRENKVMLDPPAGRRRVLEVRQVDDLQAMLREVIVSGTGRQAAGLQRNACGKTGTSDNYADAWFVGFDDTLVAGVWLGRDDHSGIGPGETGARAALPVWLDFMERAGPGHAAPQLAARLP